MSQNLIPGRYDNVIPPSIADERLREVINILLDNQHSQIQHTISRQEGFVDSNFAASIVDETGADSDSLLPVMVYCPGASLGSSLGRATLWVKPTIPKLHLIYAIRRAFGLDLMGLAFEEATVTWIDGGNPFQDPEMTARVGFDTWSDEKPTIRQFLGMIGYTMRGLLKVTVQPVDGSRWEPIELDSPDLNDHGP